MTWGIVPRDNCENKRRRPMYKLTPLREEQMVYSGYPDDICHIL